MLLDGIPGFEEAFFLSKNSEITLEFMDPEGILCYFNARACRIFARMIWVECPEIIYRVQRRKFYRLKGQGGTEIVFRVTPETEERAMVRDYSLGGLSFLREEPLPLKASDQRKDLSLRIPEDRDWFTIPISLAAVRRIDSQPRAFFYGLEFVQIQDTMGKQLARHIFEK